MPPNPKNPKKNQPTKDSALISSSVELIFSSNLIYLAFITIKPQSGTWLSAGQIKWLSPCKDPIPKGAKWTLLATNCWQYPQQHIREAIMGTPISERVETLLLSCPTQTHRLTSKQPAQWDNVLGTSFLRLRNSVSQEYVAGADCPRSQNANSPPSTYPASLLLSQLHHWQALGSLNPHW